MPPSAFRASGSGRKRNLREPRSGPAVSSACWPESDGGRADRGLTADKEQRWRCGTSRLEPRPHAANSSPRGARRNTATHRQGLLRQRRGHPGRSLGPPEFPESVWNRGCLCFSRLEPEWRRHRAHSSSRPNTCPVVSQPQQQRGRPQPPPRALPAPPLPGVRCLLLLLSFPTCQEGPCLPGQVVRGLTVHTESTGQ